MNYHTVRIFPIPGVPPWALARRARRHHFNAEKLYVTVMSNPTEEWVFRGSNWLIDHGVRIKVGGQAIPTPEVDIELKRLAEASFLFLHDMAPHCNWNDPENPIVP